MKQKKRRGRKLLSFFLTLVMVIGLLPISLPAYGVQAATGQETAAELLAPTVADSKVAGAKILEYAGKQWYVIASGSTGVQIASDAVTKADGETTLVLLAKENWGSNVKFDSSAPMSNTYGDSNLKSTIEGLVDTAKIGTYYTSDAEKWQNDLVAKRTLAGGAEKTNSGYQSEDKISSSDAVTDATLWPLSAAEVGQISDATIKQGNWWLRSPGDDNEFLAACVKNGAVDWAGVSFNYGVRPALCLNLTSNIFATETTQGSGVYQLTDHLHNFVSYTADGATITATCTASGCKLPPSSAGGTDHVATLTIAAPTNLAADGTEKAAVITDANKIQGVAAVSYYAADTNGEKTGSALGSAPTGEGKYWAEITLGSATAHVVYTITDLAYTVTISDNLVGGTVVADKTSAKYGETVTLTVTPETGFTIKTVKYNDTAITANEGVYSFTMPTADVTVSAEFEGAPYNLTISNEITGGTVTASGDGLTDNGTKAKAGSEVTLTVTPAMGFNFENLTVTKTADNSAVSVTKESDTSYKFNMPPDAVSVSAIFVGKTVTASLGVEGNEGTTCAAAMLDSTYKEVSSVTKKAGEKFILLVNRDEEYDFNVKYGTDNTVSITEFTENEYKEYLAYANKNNTSVSANTVLAWVAMPGAEDGSVTLTVTFSKMKTFTILYQPADGTNPDMVACKIDRSVNSTDETSYMVLQRGATMGDGTAVWSMKMTAAFAPKNIAFYAADNSASGEQTLASVFQNITMNDGAVSQNTNNWKDITGGGKYLIIGGEAKVVTAAFIADAKAMTTYKDNIADAPEATSGTTTYQLAVCGTDAQGNVTSFGKVQAPAAPASAPEGKEFAGWRGFEYQTVSSKATEKIYSAGDTINVRDNATFTAVWKPAKLTVKLNPNGGTNVSNPDPVTYGEKLPTLENPTRSGFVFDGWTASNTVTEDGTLFAKGSLFDLSTNITADLGLTAQWRHVHSYSCYQISAFGDRLAKYQKYETALHIAVCGCNDIQLMAHEFDSNGKCACGYQKPGAQDVTLNISYGQWSNGTYTEKMQGMQETAKQGQEVSISAPPTWGNLEFSKWQYSAGDGQWVDLTAYNYASFIIPATMQVRALYINPVTVPQVDLSARKCDDQTEVNGQTYTMDNILFHLNYKLPDGYTFEDAGIRLGDNNGISYYFIQQVRYSYDNESKGILSGITVGLVALDYLTGNLTSYDVGTGMFAEEYSVNYLETEDNVLDKELDAATLAKYMYESKPVNVEKYDPIYWEAKAVTKGMSGSMETIPPLRFAQKYGGRNYIYGIGYLRYKDKDGKIHTIYTNALPAAVKDMPNDTVTKSGS